jgi:hypothetical protein
MTFYYDSIYGLDFKYFESIGYNLIELQYNDFSFIDNLKDNDVLFITLDTIDKINESVNPNLKLNIFLFIKHEYCNEHRRKAIVENRNTNHTIYFLTTHLDVYSIENDISFKNRCYPFTNLFSKVAYIPNNNRTKKFNFFNRSINLRRLKIFELLKKKGIELNECYYTFGNIIKKDTFGNLSTIEDFINYRNRPGGGRSGNDDLVIDIEYLNQFVNEFFIYENKDAVALGQIQSSDTNDMYDSINTNSLDSYISFTIESSGDSGDDLRLTEKTIRSWLCKNIFLSLQCNGFNSALRQYGIETFEDVFGLEIGWDDNKTETQRIELFVDALKRINELSIDKVKAIYESDSVQQRLEKNYKFIMDSFNPTNTILEIDKLIGYENNVFK